MRFNPITPAQRVRYRPGEHSETLCNLWVHGTVHVVKQVEGLADQLVAVLQETLLDLALT